MRLKAIIVDLDGTLCNTTHRQHHMEAPKKDWKAFYDGIPNDLPHEWCRELIIGMRFTGAVTIFVSGRPETYRYETTEWLKTHMPGYEMLLMRGGNDFRKDSIVKTEIFKTYIEPLYDILFCVDDRQQVVDAWREHGLVCLQCAEGDF